MAINIQHTYTAHVTATFYNIKSGFSLRYDDCGSMDDIAEMACEVLVKHNFDYADVCSSETGELLMTVERS